MLEVLHKKSVKKTQNFFMTPYVWSTKFTPVKKNTQALVVMVETFRMSALNHFFPDVGSPWDYLYWPNKIWCKTFMSWLLIHLELKVPFFIME